MIRNQQPNPNRLSAFGDLAKQKRREKYSTPREMSAKSNTLVEGGISEKSIRNIECGEQVKLATLEKYCLCIGANLKDIGADLNDQEYMEMANAFSFDIDLGGAVFGALNSKAYDKLSESNLLNDQDIYNFLDAEGLRVDTRMLGLRPRSISEIAARIEEEASKTKATQYIRSDIIEPNELATHQVEQDMMWLIDPELTASDEAIEILSLIHEKTEAMYASQMFVATHNAKIAITRLKLRSSIIELLDKLNSEHGLHFLYGSANGKCIGEVVEGNSQAKIKWQECIRNILYLTSTTNEFARVSYDQWINVFGVDV